MAFNSIFENHYPLGKTYVVYPEILVTAGVQGRVTVEVFKKTDEV